MSDAEQAEAVEKLAHEMWTHDIFGPPHTRCPYQTAKGELKEENADYSNQCEPCQKHLLAVATVVVESEWLSERIAEAVPAETHEQQYEAERDDRQALGNE